jgi:hypothetical protein
MRTTLTSSVEGLTKTSAPSVTEMTRIVYIGSLKLGLFIRKIKI